MISKRKAPSKPTTAAAASTASLSSLNFSRLDFVQFGVVSGHSAFGQVFATAVSGRHVAVGGTGLVVGRIRNPTSNLHIYSIEEEKELMLIHDFCDEAKETILSVQWSADGARLFAGDDCGHVLAFSLSSSNQWKLLWTCKLGNSSYSIYSMCCFRDQLIVGPKNEICIVDADGGALRRRVAIRKADEKEENLLISCLCVSSDGLYAAVGDVGCCVTLFDARSFSLPSSTAFAHSGDVRFVAFSPDSKLLASGASKDLIVHNIGARSRQAVVKLRDYIHCGQWLEHAPMRVIVGAVDGAVFICDVQSQQLLQRIKLHKDAVMSLSQWRAPTGIRYLLSGSTDKLLCLWKQEE